MTLSELKSFLSRKNIAENQPMQFMLNLLD
jgi:hypothetical protein